MTADEIRSQREKCSDCGGALEEIKVRQYGHNNVIVPLVYLTRDAKENTWMGANVAAVEGTVLAFMCSLCARIYFYGAAKPPKGNPSKANADKRAEDQ